MIDPASQVLSVSKLFTPVLAELLRLLALSFSEPACQPTAAVVLRHNVGDRYAVVNVAEQSLRALDSRYPPVQ